MPNRLRAFCVALVLLTGCGGSDPLRSQIPTLEAHEAFRAGTIDGELAFSAIWDMAVGADGRVFVLESRGVTVLSTKGDYAGRFGGRGPGPGEFLQPASVGRLGDTVWVHDGANNRFSLFSSQGELLDLVSPQVSARSAGSFVPRPILMFADGSFLAMEGPPAHLVASGVVDTVAYLLLAADGSTVSEVFRSRARRPLWIHNPDSDNPYSGRITDQPFIAPTLVEGSASDRSIVAVTVREGVATVRKSTVEGDTGWIVRLPVALQPVTDAAVDSVIDEKAESFASSPAAEGATVHAIREWVREGLLVPEHRAPIRDLQIGADGSIWVQRVGADGTSEWVVLLGDGTVVGRAPLPRSVRVHAVSQDAVAGVVRDAVDVPYVVLYRITRRE